MTCISYMSAELSCVSEEIHGVIASYRLSNERLENPKREVVTSCVTWMPRKTKDHVWMSCVACKFTVPVQSNSSHTEAPEIEQS